MVGFVFGVILLIITIISFALVRLYNKQRKALPQNSSERNRADTEAWNRSLGGTLIGGIVGAVTLIVGGILVFLSVSFTQDVGNANVLKDITGNVVGQETQSGLHFKAPWVDTVEFNIRNQQVVFAGDQPENLDGTGGRALGPDVTVQDKDGVSADVDIAVRYSINPSSVIDIYKSFKTEDNFKQSFIEQDIRGAVRQAPNSFKTIDVLTKRSKVEQAILVEITKRWKGTGVSIDSTSLQDIRYSKSIKDSYASAQQAQIDVAKQQSKLAAIKVSAQQKVVQAQATADANNILSASLSPQVLQQKYLDALKSGTVYVVPEGSVPNVFVK